jgi:hypothetical protein
MRRVGLIQSDGIGDIVIGLPIAKAFADAGAEVFWPVNEKHVSFFAPAAPYVTFIPVPRNNPEDFFIGIPRAELRARGCEEVYVLYIRILQDDRHLQRKDLIDHLKFDEYKYAAAGVPFSRKWQLEIKRDMDREMALHRSLGIRGPYVCVHRRGHDVVANFGVPEDWRSYQMVEVEELTDSPFDWIYTFEQASKIVCIDSCFSNIVEQLNLPNEKHLILRLPNPYMPVMKNGWQFIRLPEAPQAEAAR